jgi:hypothetical protein
MYEHWGFIENKHLTDVESSTPPPRVCMVIGGLLGTSTRSTFNPHAESAHLHQLLP